MRPPKKIILILLFIQTLVYAQPYAASIGNTKLYYTSYTAPIARSSTKTLSYGFLKKVGGVSFEQTLVTDQDILINYIPTNEDGNRLQLIIDDTISYPSIMDWQLKPIVEFADSQNPAVVSLLGKNEEVNSDEFYNIQYHKAFENTLLGLRLLQVDLILLNVFELHELPKDKYGNTLLGHEEQPVQEVDSTQLNKVYNFMNLFNELDTASSWLFTDTNKGLAINDANDQIIMENPYYYFWKEGYKIDKTDSLEVFLDDKSTLEFLMKIYLDEISTCFSEIDVYEEEKIYLLDVRKYNKNEVILKLFNEYMELNRKYLNEDREIEAIELNQMNEYFDGIYYEIIKSINPQIYEAAENTMKFSALFRHLKNNNPEKWRNFKNETISIDVPYIGTPTQLPRSIGNID